MNVFRSPLRSLGGAALALLLLCAVAPLGAQTAAPAASPANVAGNWTLSMQGRDGNTISQQMTVTQNGAAIKGTLKSPRGERDFTGAVNGNDVTWDMSFQTPDGNTFTIHYKATVSGDAMKGTITFGTGQFTRDFTAQRTTAA